MRKHRIGLIGCGNIGKVHAGNLFGPAELVFCSRTRARAEEFQQRFGGQVAESFQDLLAMDEVAAVVIATPPEYHAEQTIAALGAGKSVLVEKPLCASAAEVDQIEVALQEGRPHFVMVAENYYYKPSLAQLKQMMVAGVVGAVRRFEVQKLTQQVASGWKSGYGALLEGGIHFVALIGDLADAVVQGGDQPTSPTSVSAVFPAGGSGEPERHSQLELMYAGGLEARLRYAWDVPSLTRGAFQHGRILGDEGYIGFESNGLYVWTRGRSGTRLRLPGMRDLMGYGMMTRDFLACLDDPGRVPYSNLARARRDLSIVFEAYGGAHRAL